MLLLDSLGAHIRSPLLWLAVNEGRVVVVASDLDLPSDVSIALCSEDGFYQKLASIRFTHFFDQTDTWLEQLAAVVYPPIQRWVAVPMYRDGVVVGSISACRDQQSDFDAREVLLLSMVSVMLSMTGDLPNSRKEDT